MGQPTMHPESLCNLPLLGQFLADPHVQRQPRAVDKHWTYNKLSSITVTGFNPFLQTVFYGAHSAFAAWLADPAQSARRHNEGDFLVKEVLFAVHDYLHLWAYRAIHALAPELEICRAPITRSNIEQFAFCHLLTEAVATVGLDYWYLSTVKLDDIVPIGTNMKMLTVSYHEDNLKEYHRFCPSLTVQHPSFYAKICDFYCSGIFRGFDVNDIKASPKTLGWLRHELTYGVEQRRYTRMWLRYLSRDEISYEAAELSAPVATDQPWQRRLISGLGELLWEKVKKHKLHDFPDFPSRDEVWRSDPAKPADFRFLNVNSVDPSKYTEDESLADPAASFLYLFWQYVSKHDFKRFDRNLLPLLAPALEKRSLKVVQALCLHQPKLAETDLEPRDLLILN